MHIHIFAKTPNTSMHKDVNDYRTIDSLMVSVSQIWATGQQ